MRTWLWTDQRWQKLALSARPQRRDNRSVVYQCIRATSARAPAVVFGKQGRFESLSPPPAAAQLHHEALALRGRRR
jgi:hypothetical protein